jgi:hypothetical protein
VRKLLTRSIAAAAAVGALAPAQALAAPVSITSLSISPACTHDGGTITASVTVKNSTPTDENFFAQTQASWLGVLNVGTSPASGPYTADEYSSASHKVTATVPSFALPGTYNVTLGIGPSASDPMGWSTATSSFSVWPWC